MGIFFLLSLILVLSFTSCTSGLEKPNIILFLADDLSYADLGCHMNHSRVKKGIYEDAMCSFVDILPSIVELA